MGDKPVEAFLPGWHASALFTGFAPLFLLELENIDGGRATWFLDHRFHYLGGDVAQLSPEAIGLLKLGALPLLGTLVDIVTRYSNIRIGRPLQDFLGVNEATRLAIGIVCQDELVRMPASYLVEHLMPHSLTYRDENDILRSIDRNHLADGLRDDLQDRIGDWVRAGTMSWPSPVDGRMLNAQGTLVFDDFHFAFRFDDPANGLVFFVLAADHNSRIAGIWFPCMGFLVSLDELHRGLARMLIPHIPRWFVMHPLQWADQLIPYLQSDKARFASVVRGRPGTHLGHQLWNELSGIDKYVDASPDALPEWIVLNAEDGIEMYGPIDRIFPELEGRVNRTLPDIRAMISWAYRERVFVLRITREFVSKRLRQEIRTYVAATRSARKTVLALESIPTGPVILIGLRVENRTLVDLPGFLHQLLGALVARHPGLVVVFDGHNSRSEDENGQMIESHGEGVFSQQPIDIERQLLSDLRASFADADITIADTLGAPISASIAWCEAADCFVSIWGASLAKYRWVCNKPGFVITSRLNLLQRNDLHIYDAPRYMEDPSSLEFVDPDAVTDQPDAPQLIDVGPGQPAFYNFTLDEARVLPHIMAMVERNVPGTST
ncbi:MAG: hypothetical protein ACRYGI_14960 [Janthinobacterium lividum]